jgi:restriction system protein
VARTKKILAPTYTELIVPTYKALLELGGSGNNNEIYEQVIKDLQLSDEAVDESHLGNENQTELQYQLAWARTYLKNYGVIINSTRSVWSITSDYTCGVELDPREVVAHTARKKCSQTCI